MGLRGFLKVYLFTCYRGGHVMLHKFLRVVNKGLVIGSGVNCPSGLNPASSHNPLCGQTSL